MENILYINLERRIDRREQIENELTNFQLKFERFEAIDEKEGILGCTKSHLGALKLAKKRGWKSVLILEDDFTFLVTCEQFEVEITQLIESEINYDVCMLAYNLLSSEDNLGCNHLIKVLEASTASAYIVREHYYDVLIKLYEDNVLLLEETREHWNYANDVCWKILQKNDNWVCTKTRVGKQRARYSDNSCVYVDYNC